MVLIALLVKQIRVMPFLTFFLTRVLFYSKGTYENNIEKYKSKYYLDIHELIFVYDITLSKTIFNNRLGKFD